MTAEAGASFFWRADIIRRLLFMLAAAVTACAAAPERQTAKTPVSTSPYRAVLVAGSNDLTVFDHATSSMRGLLGARQVASGDIQRLSAAPRVFTQEGVAQAGLGQVVTAIEALRPSEGQACFVFVTSHGAPKLGLFLAPKEEFLTPVALDRALTAGCGEAPTVVIASGCYSGGFARIPMARANRVVLTAARADRPSFGCGAGFDYTVYDKCLLRAMEKSAIWREVYASVRGCVGTVERALRFEPSGPQAWFGASVTDLALPARD